VQGVHLLFVGGTPMSSAYISAHQQSSEDIQKHSRGHQKYVQSMSEEANEQALILF
jgi:hypothetical protein